MTSRSRDDQDFERIAIQELSRKAPASWPGMKILWQRFPRLSKAVQARIMSRAVYIASERAEVFPIELFQFVELALDVKPARSPTFLSQEQREAARLLAAQLVVGKPNYREIGRKIGKPHNLVIEWEQDPKFQRELEDHKANLRIVARWGAAATAPPSSKKKVPGS